MFRINNATSENSVTTHEVLATAVTVILKQTADFNTCNKLLKVTKPFGYGEYDLLLLRNRWRCCLFRAFWFASELGFIVQVSYEELVGCSKKKKRWLHDLSHPNDIKHFLWTNITGTSFQCNHIQFNVTTSFHIDLHNYIQGHIFLEFKALLDLGLRTCFYIMK